MEHQVVQIVQQVNILQVVVIVLHVGRVLILMQEQQVVLLVQQENIQVEVNGQVVQIVGLEVIHQLLDGILVIVVGQVHIQVKVQVYV